MGDCCGEWCFDVCYVFVGHCWIISCYISSKNEYNVMNIYSRYLYLDHPRGFFNSQELGCHLENLVFSHHPVCIYIICIYEYFT